MLLRDSEREDILKGTFVLDCPVLQLTPHSLPSDGPSYTGSGILSQTEGGYFAIKLYLSNPVSILECFGAIDQWKAGEIIDERFKYRLTAKDLQGREWSAEGILPDINTGPGGTIILGKAAQLNFSEPYEELDINYLGLSYSGHIPFPENTYLHTETNAGGRRRRGSSRLVMSRFSACGTDFEVERHDGFTTLRAHSKQITFHEKAINCVIEAFAFITGNDSPWSICEIGKNKVIEVRVQAERKAQKVSKIGPPLRIDPHKEEIWKLFGLFLSFGLKSEEDSTHPLRRYQRAVLASDAATLEVRALMLSVSVEALITNCFSDLPYGQAVSEESINKARKHMDAMTDMDDTFKKRVDGLLRSMSRPRAADCLKYLCDKELIDPAFRKTFLELRNKSAHGVPIAWAEIQSYLNQCGAMLVLFYHLIFLRIGYTGPYTDYGTFKFPNKDFKATLQL